MCFLSGRHRTVDIQPLRSWGNARRSDLADVCTAGHAQARNRQKWKTKAAKQKPLVSLSLQNPGCSLLRPSPAQSFCPFVISNAHLFPLIKGIIIYNFLLKNQLCILSIADRNSQLVTWLEKIDRNSSLWKEKKGCSKIIYRRKKPCCRTFSNYEDFQQCSKIKDSSKIRALGFQTHMPPTPATLRVLAHVTECVCTHSEGVTGF